MIFGLIEKIGKECTDMYLTVKAKILKGQSNYLEEKQKRSKERYVEYLERKKSNQRLRKKEIKQVDIIFNFKKLNNLLDTKTV